MIIIISDRIDEDWFKKTILKPGKERGKVCSTQTLELI